MYDVEQQWCTSNQIQDHQSYHIVVQREPFFPRNWRFLLPLKQCLNNERHTRSNDSDYSATTTMQGQVAKIVIVMEYLAARGDLTLYFGLITRNNYHNITLGKKRHHHHSKPTDQKCTLLVNEVFDTWIWIHISHVGDQKSGDFLQ